VKNIVGAEGFGDIVLIKNRIIFYGQGGLPTPRRQSDGLALFVGVHDNEGIDEGKFEGFIDVEGIFEGVDDDEGIGEGTFEGFIDIEGIPEGFVEGICDCEGVFDTEGRFEGSRVGATEDEIVGIRDGDSENNTGNAIITAPVLASNAVLKL